MSLAMDKQLIYAIANSDLNDCLWSIERGASVDAIITKDQGGKNQSVLIKAAALDKSDVMKALIDGGADIEKSDDKGMTALMESLHRESTTSLKLMLDAKANIETKDKKGMTALIHAAMMYSGEDCVRMLIDHGSDIQTKDNNGFDALSTAVFEGWTESARILIKAGANVNSVDNNSDAPLSQAATIGEVESVILLIESGADIHHQNNDGHTAIDLAGQADRLQVAEIIQMYLDHDTIIKQAGEVTEPVKSKTVRMHL